MIGSGGKNIKGVAENIALSDSNVQPVRKEAEKDEEYEALGVNADLRGPEDQDEGTALRANLKTDVESAEKVLVTVEMNTSSREEFLMW